jgi:hypothetical protein
MDGSASPRAGVGVAPTLNELHAFVVLADELHFGRAARRMGVTQPSLSEAIRRLEARLGVVLFERTSRRVGLSDAGALLLPGVRRVLADLADVQRAAAMAAPRRSPPRPPAAWSPAPDRAARPGARSRPASRWRAGPA